jgi:hypothetical protein
VEARPGGAAVVTTSYLTCDGCFTRFELEVKRSAGDTMPDEQRALVYSFLLQMALICMWRVDGDRHTCPRCK